MIFDMNTMIDEDMTMPIYWHPNQQRLVVGYCQLNDMNHRTYQTMAKSTFLNNE